ncbi:bifunctional 4-hydroxy-2-oxoglutarate aldolase/2-dehydro-3-deoxy-phosphogluconate aldolase [Jiangella anatolica]|uniref:bifunctional 4-hydroxy-2-oxoglutarate aldolase/2-dehydro-3-deoxy-phosphogluconate aldolase n=1 Tax=Jiangella anatolica TaxID=2670374 RepID=UPI001313DFDB|nr:bifunctional 4-hydroxy-2-oxoglutarate aldolase/2-dehydro-3-deoxy-phosphogluconate aldolase [Jiangella anatolica]
MPSGKVPSGILAVVRASSADDAIMIGECLADAGVGHIEITFTVPDASAVIHALADATGATIGAGTVTSVSQAAAAIQAGAEFVVSPTLNGAVLEHARNAAVPAIAGAMTPTEIEQAIRAGADGIKVFPVSAVGGPAYVSAVAEVFPGVRWVASGGIAASSVEQYRRAGCTAVCLGNALIDRAALARRDLAQLVTSARQALAEAGSG